MALRYCKIEGLRQKALNDRDDASRDTELTKLGEKYESLLDAALFPFTTVPLTGANIDDAVIETTESGAAWAFHRQVDNDKRAADYKDAWKEGRKTLINKYRAIPTDRTKSILVAKDPRSLRTILPTQATNLAFDNYT